MKTAQAKLLTVVVPFAMGAQLTGELKALGVSGYTSMQVNGFGVKGARAYGLTDGANLRIETIVSQALCDRLMDHIAAHYAGAPFVAHAHDVTAIPADHFDS